MKQPVIDIAECTDCEGCVSLCPTVFLKNNAGYIEVAELLEYPFDEVSEAIKNCPGHCIQWIEK